MLKVYGSDLCPDCVDLERNFDHYKIEYEFIDINKNLADLKTFLKMRDFDPVFEPCKQNGTIGIPAIVMEDGTISIDHEDFLKKLGYEPLQRQVKMSCSIESRNC